MAEEVRPAYVASVREGGADNTFIGEVRAGQRAELAFAVSGRVLGVHVETGDKVRAGQVLARLDEQPLRAQWVAAMADVSRAEAQLAEIRLRSDRLKLAQEANAISAAELTGIRAEMTSAEAALRSAHAQAELAKWSLDHALLRAPIDGVVATRGLEPGQTAGPGAPAIILDGAGRELSLLIPERLPIKPGQPVRLRNETTEATSRVLRINERMETGGLRRIFLSAPAHASVGATWRVMLSNENQSPSLQIPLRAVLPTSQSETGMVLRLGADRRTAELPLGEVLRIGMDGHTTELVKVQLGALSGDWIEIRSGLTARDRVVVAGAAGIQPGSLVKPVPYTNTEVQP